MSELPEPRLTHVYRLEATLGEPLDVGDVSQGFRRIIPQTGGTFTGPELNGRLLPRASADWQTVPPDGPPLGGNPPTPPTDDGALLFLQSPNGRPRSPPGLPRA